MANAKRQFNNLRGWLADVAAARRQVAEGDREAGELLDRLCDDLDLLLDFGSEDDAAGDVGHDEGGEDPEDADDEPDAQLDLPSTRRERVAGGEQAPAIVQHRGRDFRPRASRFSVLPGPERMRRK